MWILMEAQGYSLEKAMAPHSSTLAWKIPRTEEPGGLQSMGLLRVGHDWVTSLSHFHFSLSCIGEGNGNPLQCSCLENPRDRRAWWAAIYGVAQIWTWLKRLSSSSSILKLPIDQCERPDRFSVLNALGLVGVGLLYGCFCTQEGPHPSRVSGW